MFDGNKWNLRLGSLLYTVGIDKNNSSIWASLSDNGKIYFEWQPLSPDKEYIIPNTGNNHITDLNNGRLKWLESVSKVHLTGDITELHEIHPVSYNINLLLEPGPDIPDSSISIKLPTKSMVEEILPMDGCPYPSESGRLSMDIAPPPSKILAAQGNTNSSNIPEDTEFTFTNDRLSKPLYIVPPGKTANANSEGNEVSFSGKVSVASDNSSASINGEVDSKLTTSEDGEVISKAGSGSFDLTVTWGSPIIIV